LLTPWGTAGVLARAPIEITGPGQCDLGDGFPLLLNVTSIISASRRRGGHPGRHLDPRPRWALTAMQGQLIAHFVDEADRALRPDRTARLVAAMARA